MTEQNNVVRLRFPDSIRCSPGMYIGCTEEPSHLFREIIDNSIDELVNNKASNVHIFYDDSVFTCVDDGSGMPIYMDKENPDVSIIHALLTETHVGSKFSVVSDDVSIGLHGTGNKAGCATSEFYEVYVRMKNTKINKLPKKYKIEIKKGNDILKVRYERGILTEEVCISKLPDYIDSSIQIDKFSTIVRMKPDHQIFDSIKGALNETNLKTVKLINPNGSIQYNGREILPLENSDIFNNAFIDDTNIPVDFEVKGSKFKIFFGYSTDDFEYQDYGSVNTIESNGFHVKTVQTALCKALARKMPKIPHSNYKFGLKLFVLVLANKPQYSSQTKERLTKIEDLSRTEIIDAFDDVFSKVFDKNKKYLSAISNRLFEYMKEIGKLSIKDIVDDVIIKGDNKKKLNGMGVDVYDAVNKDRSKTELFIVEGASAGSGLIQARSLAETAVLPLRGKPLNTAKVESLERIIQNKEMKSMLNVIGASVYPYVDISTIRYGKIILTADPDPDGKAINAILLGAFATLLPEVVEAGYLYVVDIPLYKQGNKFVYDKNELNLKKDFSRFKGLGEMSVNDLYTTCINKETRRLIQITTVDMAKAVVLIKSSAAKKELMMEAGVVV